MKKNKKFTITIIVMLIAAIASLGASVAFGGLKKETWEQALEKLRTAQGLHAIPIEREIQLEANEISRLKVDGSGEKITIRHGDTEKIIVKYYEDYKNQSVVTISGNMLELDRKQKSIISFDSGLNWYFNRDYEKISITLPLGVSFSNSNIRISGGSFSATGINLGNLNHLKLSGGSMRFDDCIIASMNIDISGGDLFVNNGALLGKVDVELSGGHAEFKNLIDVHSFSFDISGGTVTLSNLPVSSSQVLLNVKKNSGNSIYFNGKKTKTTITATSTPIVEIKVEISGGSLNVTTL